MTRERERRAKRKISVTLSRINKVGRKKQKLLVQWCFLTENREEMKVTCYMRMRSRGESLQKCMVLSLCASREKWKLTVSNLKKTSFRELLLEEHDDVMLTSMWLWMRGKLSWLTELSETFSFDRTELRPETRVSEQKVDFVGKQ